MPGWGGLCGRAEPEEHGSAMGKRSRRSSHSRTGSEQEEALSGDGGTGQGDLPRSVDWAHAHACLFPAL